jgi:NADPH-dependent curcumin reductase CurA
VTDEVLTMNRTNRQVILISRPAAAASVANFQLRHSTITTPAAGEVLVRTLYLSIDPWLRTVMNDAALLPLDTVVPGDVLGRVVESRHPLFRAGDIVQGLLGWQQYVAAPYYLLRKIDPSAGPITMALGLLGSSGLTACIGLFLVGRIKRSESVVVSAAAGAVGSAAAQLAKLAGCHVTGIAGSDEKVRYLTDDLGLNAAFNYKTDAWRAQIAVHNPFGVDVYFDNVGGRVSDAVLPVMNTKARVVVCGQLASCDRRAAPSRLPWLGVVLEKRIRLEGFLVTDYGEHFPAALEALTRLWRAGLLRSRETIAYGLERAPEAFIAMLQGHNIGKQLVQVE